MAELPPVDREAVEQFARAHFASAGEPEPKVLPEAGYFGDSVELADKLLDVILTGPKRATAGSVADYEADGDPIPQVGDLWIACDGRGQPRVMLRTTEVRVGPLSSVDEQFAWDEGEGDRSLDYWMEAHTRFFKRRYELHRLTFHPDIAVVFERFDALLPE